MKNSRHHSSKIARERGTIFGKLPLEYANRSLPESMMKVLLIILLCVSTPALFGQVTTQQLEELKTANAFNPNGGRQDEARVLVRQVGEENKIDVQQVNPVGAEPNALIILQQGDYNRLRSVQQGEGNENVVRQEGTQNRTESFVRSHRSRTQVFQQGQDNAIRQNFDGNGLKSAQLVQQGKGNVIDVNVQSNAKLKQPIRVLQKGKAPAVKITIKQN